jgi:hypothetical protein
MATVLQEYTTEEQRSVVLFWGAKGLNVKDIHKKKYFMFKVGNVCGVKWFTAEWQRFR